MNHLLASLKYLSMGISDYVYLSLLWFTLELAPKEDVLLALSCQAFARLLLADFKLVLWSRRMVALRQVYVRSLLICLSLLYYCSITVVAYCFFAFRLLYTIAIAFQVNTGVSYFRDYVEVIYDDGPLCPV